MELGPCHGWLTANATLRQVTSARAAALSNTLRKVATRARFDNFDVHFVENPFKAVISDWTRAGGHLWQLLEPVDGLHPTQAAQSLISEELWHSMENQLPHVLGPINPRNEDIKRLFGEQGGH